MSLGYRQGHCVCGGELHSEQLAFARSTKMSVILDDLFSSRHPIPVFLPGESLGRGSLVGCCLWGHTESDMTGVTQQQQQQQQCIGVKWMGGNLEGRRVKGTPLI